MKEKTLGTLQRVNLRTFWQNEPRDFTPWLVQEENMRLLGETLGIELEVENTEVAVGPYSADILAKDIGTGRYVVIENQLNKTDHDHLGKALTYASVLDASSVIWLAGEFTEEHQKALDWLNEHTVDELGFYGVVVELWTIDDSQPAVRFNVMSRPADIMKEAARTKASESLSDAKRLQLEFWQQFRDTLVKTKKIASVQKARPQYWFDVSLGKSGIHLSNIANTFDGKIGIRVYINNKIAEYVLPQLEAQKAAIEEQIGQTLLWNPNPTNKDKIIVLYRDADLNHKESWSQYLEWLVEYTLKFEQTFRAIVKRLNSP